MKVRTALSVSRPLTPVIVVGTRSTAHSQHRGLALIWRLPSKRLSPPAERRPEPASWALTINLFFKSAAGLREALVSWHGSRSPERLNQPRSHCASNLVWRAPAMLRIERQTELLRSILRRLVLPEIASVEKWRTVISDLLPIRPETRPVAARPLPSTRSWANRSRPDVKAHTKPRRPLDLFHQQLPRPWRDRPLSLVSTSRSPRTPSDLFSAAHPDRGLAQSLTIISPRRNRFLRLHPSGNAIAERTSPFPRQTADRIWRRERHASAQKPTRPARARSTVELVWPSRKDDSSAAGATSIPIAVSALTTREVSSDFASVKQMGGQDQAAPPDVDRLVDEVFRRMDRQFRSERLRRGL